MYSDYYVLIFILFFCIYLFFLKTRKSDIKVVKSKDGLKEHYVLNDGRYKEAAELLEEIKKRLENLVNRIFNNIDKYTKKKKDIKRLKKRFNSENCIESSPKADYTSYTLNKGEEIHLCLRYDNENKKLHDINTIMFVAIHELAHVMSKSTGHNKEFTKNFIFLLKCAFKYNLYEIKNYREKEEKYCGIKIDNTPLKDKDIKILLKK